MIHDSSSACMLFLIDDTEIVLVFAEGCVGPGGIEVGFLKWILISIELLDRSRIRACKFIGSDSNEAPILGMKFHLDLVHVAVGHSPPYPEATKRSQGRPGDLCEGMDRFAVEDPT